MSSTSLSARRSETCKHREQALEYCVGNGVDLGAGGDPVTPAALSIDLSKAAAARYTTTDHGVRPIQWRGDCKDLFWFRDGVLDYVYSSHVIEDFTQAEQPAVLAEWGRVVKPGGYLIVIYPENRLWAQAVDAGQPMNSNHQWEPHGGEIAGHLRTAGWEIVEDRLANPMLLTDAGVQDYSWLTVAKR